MKSQKLFLWVCILIVLGIRYLSAQQMDTAKAAMDVLKAPVSPAANLIGISDAQIDRPSDPAAFMTLINQSSSNYTALPTRVAMDLAPAWIFNGRKITLKSFMENKVRQNICQSFVLSVATKATDSLGNTSGSPTITKLATGIKFSLLRGKLDSSTSKTLDQLHRIRSKSQQDFIRKIDSLQRINRDLQALNENIDKVMRDTSLSFSVRLLIVENMRLKKQTILDSLQKAVFREPAELKKIAEKINFYRYGVKLDVAAGAVYDFPLANFEKGKLVKAGAWLTGGYEFKNGFSILGIARYLYNPKTILADDSAKYKTKDVSTFDVGARFLLSTMEKKFTLSGEGIYRSALNIQELDPTWRFTMNASYDLGKNKLLTFIFGKDFDGTITKDGNLVVGLNLLLGFGSKK